MNKTWLVSVSKEAAMELTGQPLNLASPDVQYSNVRIIYTGRDIVPVLDIMPNPVKDKLSVYVYRNSDASVQVDITDAAGRSLLRRQAQLSAGANQIEFSEAANWAPGNYFISITSVEGEKMAGKFIKVSH